MLVQRSFPSASPWRLWLFDTACASSLSAALLAWRGRIELGSAAGPLNAPSHVLWGERALRRNALTWQFTGSGATLHLASAGLWAGLYRALRALRQRPSRADALIDAVAVTTVAAVVDLKLTPRHLGSGLERRLSPRGVGWIYAGFAAGLAVSGLCALARRPR